MSKKMTIAELIPTDGRKSFYSKAKVIDDGRTKYLLSYDTVVASIKDDTVRRHWSGKSYTTSRHVRAFVSAYGGRQMSTSEFYSLPCVKHGLAFG